MFELHASPGFVPRLRGQVNFGTNDNTCYFILFFPINFLTPRHNHATLLLKVAKEEKRPSAECMDDHWWRCSGRNHEGRDLRFSAHFPSASHCIWIASNTCRFSEESYLDTNTCEAVLSSGSGIFFDPDIENGPGIHWLSLRISYKEYWLTGPLTSSMAPFNLVAAVMFSLYDRSPQDARSCLRSMYPSTFVRIFRNEPLNWDLYDRLCSRLASLWASRNG